jgi:hypothetical protein
MQPVPTHGEMMQVGIGQSRDGELRDQFFQRLPVQRVKDLVATLGMLPDLIHRGLIDSPPAVDQRGPVGLDAARLAPFGEIRNQAGAPVDDSAEDVEHQGFHRGNISHTHSRVRPRWISLFLIEPVPARRA